MHSRETDTLTAQIITALANSLYLPPGSMTAQTPIADLGLDSLDMVEAVLELEVMLGRTLSDADLVRAQTIGDLVAGCTGGLARRSQSFALVAHRRKPMVQTASPVPSRDVTTQWRRAEASWKRGRIAGPSRHGHADRRVGRPRAPS
jgi:acyl carrier protein